MKSTHLDCKIKNSIISSLERSKKLSKKVQKSLRLRPNELHQTLIDAFISLSRLLHSTNACKKTLTFFFLNITQTISLCNFFSVEFIFFIFFKGLCNSYVRDQQREMKRSVELLISLKSFAISYWNLCDFFNKMRRSYDVRGGL